MNSIRPSSATPQPGLVGVAPDATAPAPSPQEQVTLGSTPLPPTLPPRPTVAPPPLHNTSGPAAPPPMPVAAPPPPPVGNVVTSLLGTSNFATNLGSRLNRVLAPLTGTRPAPNANPSPQDARTMMLAQQRQYAVSNVVPHGPTTLIAERGASQESNYQDLATFAAKNGSLDGTPITARSNYSQDSFHWAEARQAAQAQVNNVARVRQSQCAPPEAQTLQRLDAQTSSPYPPMSTTDLLLRQSVLQGAYDRGELPTGTPLHQAFQGFSQSLEMLNKTEANIFHKWAQFRKPGAGAPQLTPQQQSVYASSPFSPAAATSPPMPAAATLSAAQHFVDARASASPPDRARCDQLQQQCDARSTELGLKPLSTADLQLRRDALRQAYTDGSLTAGTPMATAFQAFSAALDSETSPAPVAPPLQPRRPTATSTLEEDRTLAMQCQGATESALQHLGEVSKGPDVSAADRQAMGKAMFEARPSDYPQRPLAERMRIDRDAIQQAVGDGRIPPGSKLVPAFEAFSTALDGQLLAEHAVAVKQTVQESLQHLGTARRDNPAMADIMGKAMQAGRPAGFATLSPSARLGIDAHSLQQAVAGGQIPADSAVGQNISRLSAAVDQQVALGA